MNFFNDVHYKKSGTYNGYSIIFFHGLNKSAFDYGDDKNNLFLKYLEKLSQVFIYDRPESMLLFNSNKGLPTNADRYIDIIKNTTLIHHCHLLQNLLDKCEIKPPYVLVGHCLGTLYALRFANVFKNKIKALFLLEPIYYTPSISRSSFSRKLKDKDIESLTKVCSLTFFEKIMNHTLAAPLFTIDFTFPLVCFYRKGKTSNKNFKEYNNFLKDNNPMNYKFHIYDDASKYLTETNSLSIAYKIKNIVNSKK